MPALSNKNYFNYGGQGPLPEPSLQAIISSWREIQELGPFSNDVCPYISNETSKTRQVLARLCGVNQKRLALTENVSSGCVLPLWGIPFNTGDHILISDCEHPGVVAACYEIARRFNLYIDIFKVQKIKYFQENQHNLFERILNLIEQQLKSNTRLVVISHLLWNTGLIMPIKEISKMILNHSSKPFLLVDGAQSFGQISSIEEASSSDIYAFTGHKWAFGPEGLGGVALSERILSEAHPTLIGWRALKDENIYERNNSFHKDSRRFEIATSCVPLMAGLRRSLELLESEGNIEHRLLKIKDLSAKLWEGISRINNSTPFLNSPPPSGLISFYINNEYSTKKTIQKLCEKKVFLRSLEQPKLIRACVHITTEEEEIYLLIKALKEVLN